MSVSAWLRRLTAELPGWHVWCSTPGPHWNAVPAAADVDHQAALRLPNRVSARTPQQLRALVRERL